MPRVKRGVPAHARHKKILGLATGHKGQRHRVFKRANESVLHSLDYAYGHRRERKGDFRKLWIARINAASRMESPQTASSLLAAAGEEEAKMLAVKLNRINDERKGLVSATVREVKEETGLDAEVVRLVSIYHIADRNSVGFQFLCRVIGGELRVDGGEISEAKFFDPAHLPVPMTEPGRQRVVDALANCDQPILREFATLEIIEA